MPQDLVTIVHCSDLHSDHGFLQAIVDHGNTVGAEILVHSGDFVDAKSLALYTRSAIEEKRQRAFSNIDAPLWARNDLVQNLRKAGSAERFRQALLDPDQPPEVVDRLLPVLEEYLHDPKAFEKSFRENDAPRLQQYQQELNKFAVAVTKRVEDALLADYARIDRILGGFNGEVLGILGNHDTVHARTMQNIRLVNGLVKVKDLTFLLSPETQEAISGFPDLWLHHTLVPFKEEMDAVVRESMVQDDISEEEAQKRFLRLSPQYASVDLDTPPDIVYFHKPYGNLGDTLDRLETRSGNRPRQSALAHFIMQKHGSRIAYMGGGHYHGGWLGKEEGVTKIVACPTTAYTVKLDAATKKLVEITKLRWKPRDGHEYFESVDYHQFLRSGV